MPEKKKREMILGVTVGEICFKEWLCLGVFLLKKTKARKLVSYGKPKMDEKMWIGIDLGRQVGRWLVKRSVASLKFLPKK